MVRLQAEHDGFGLLSQARRHGERSARHHVRALRSVALALFTLFAWPASALEVQGNQFIDNGQPIVLRGIAMGDVTDLPADQNPYPEIATEWGANAVRLSIHPGTWRDEKAKALETLTRHVEQARAANLYVIIDWHAIGFPDGYSQQHFDVTRPDTKTDYYDSRFSLAMDFWMTVALHFQDTAILYELWNEPTTNIEEEGGGDLSYWKRYRPYWRVLTDAVRASGSTNIMLVAPPLWAFNLRGLKDSLLPDEQTAYTWHVYGDAFPEEWADTIDGLDELKPIVVSEWGFEPDAKQHWAGTAEEYGQPLADFMDARGLSSTAWCWNPDYGPSLRKPNGKPTIWGEFAQGYLKKHAVVQ